MSDDRPDERFLGLVASLQMSAWIQLGKVMNPATGRAERNLDHAKETIDVLGVLQAKTHGNLHAEEEKFLTRMLLDLRMNYIEELKSAAAAPPSADSEGR